MHFNFNKSVLLLVSMAMMATTEGFTYPSPSSLTVSRNNDKFDLIKNSNIKRKDSSMIVAVSAAEASADDDAWETTDEARTNIELFLSKKFPSFYDLLCNEDDIWKTLKGQQQYTLFAPNEDAFATKLTDKQRLQLSDPRNLEPVQKIGLYHICESDKLTKESLLREDWRGPKPTDGSPRPFVVGGIQTMGGEVPVGRAKSGGIEIGPITLGGKEDGDAIVGPNARILKSYLLGEEKNIIIHEMDNLISPELLWRYCDQLRIL